MKVLQYRGKRIPIRLEHVFWLQLEELAREAGVRLTNYVHQVLHEAEDTSNRASVLRCHCLKAARDAKIAAFLSEGDINLTLMLTACPSPAFILKDERTIIAHNPAFAARFMSVTDGDQKARRFVKISYARPFSKLRQFLQQNPNKALNTLLVLTTGKTVHNCRARLLLVGQQENSYMMAFFEDQLTPVAQSNLSRDSGA